MDRGGIVLPAPFCSPTLLDAFPFGVMLLDGALRVVAMNRFLEAWTGRSATEVCGLPGELVLQHGVAERQQFFASVLRDGEPVSRDGDIIDRNRRRFPVRFTVSALGRGEDAGQGVVVVMEDISLLQDLDRGGLGGAVSRQGILGHSPPMLEVFELLPILSQTDATVLVTGETGTGKDLLAEAIHKGSRRASHPFVKVNCGALPESLLESELFGHVRGAFTGAHSDKPGMFQLAQGGTIFLTEIGDLPLPLQVKLLTVLDDREFFPLGSSRKVKVDVRLITGTHRDLKQLVREGRFREDLYFRLNVLRAHMPPLRERDGDVRLLLDFFVSHFCAALGCREKTFSAKALALLLGYGYPGNVRELRNIVEFAVTLCRAERIEPEHLPPYLPAAGDVAGGQGDGGSAGRQESNGVPVSLGPQPQTWSGIERQRILEALLRCDGNRSKAAAVLGWGRSTLWRKMKLYELE